MMDVKKVIIIIIAVDEMNRIMNIFMSKVKKKISGQICFSEFDRTRIERLGLLWDLLSKQKDFFFVCRT